MGLCVFVALPPQRVQFLTRLGSVSWTKPSVALPAAITMHPLTLGL